MALGYSLVSTAVVMFCIQIYLNSFYEKQGNNNTRAVFKFTLGSFITGFIILSVINKFKYDFTWFSAAVAFCAAVNMILYLFCSLKSFSTSNLSLYSVFCSLGGMVIPFAVGIFFYGEKVTTGKIICFILVVAALVMTVEKDKKTRGTLYYIGVFIFNGMSGVLSTLHSKSGFHKSSDSGYSILIALFVIVLCVILLIFNKDANIKLNLKSYGCIAGYGIMSNVGSYFLLLGLSRGLPASAQYPFVTGGIMIVSTIICYFTPDKPKKKEIAAVALSLAGILALCIIDK